MICLHRFILKHSKTGVLVFAASLQILELIKQIFIWMALMEAWSFLCEILYVFHTEKRYSLGNSSPTSLLAANNGLRSPPSCIKHIFLHHCSRYSSRLLSPLASSSPYLEETTGKELAAEAGCSALEGRVGFQPQGLGSLDRVWTQCFCSFLILPLFMSTFPPPLPLLFALMPCRCLQTIPKNKASSTTTGMSHCSVKC